MSGFLSGLLALLWLAWPWFAEDPMRELATRLPARIITDCQGEALLYERCYDYAWRFPVPLTAISPEMVKVMLAVEDERFYRHHGVDYRAVARAAWQDLGRLRIVSGASTISMQVAGWTMPEHRSILGKIKQAVRARRLEQLHSKAEILEAYLNHVPFGGKLYGVEAAAEYYFGTTAARLGLSEAALLCGIPQKPNRYRPDRCPDAAAMRHRRVLAQLVRQGVIDAAGAAAAERTLPGYRDFKVPVAFAKKSAARDLRYPIEQALAAGVTAVSIDSALTEQIRELLRKQRDRLGGVRDGAAVLIENATGCVRAYVGTLDFDAAAAGQVDACRAWRSAGSTLKPFLYAEAIHGGLLVADTWLDDSPVRFGTYAPLNFDKTFNGKVTAAEALSRSLNTPAVRLVSELGTNRVEELFRKLEILAAPHGEEAVRASGLTLALGCEGHRLLDLTRAYTVFANGGVLLPLRFAAESRLAPTEAKRIFAPGVTEMVADMLRLRPLLGAGPEVAWKTGTSNNLRDAWCFAFTAEWTLGVWFGNKNGERAEALVGALAAAPIAGEILEHCRALGRTANKQEVTRMEATTGELCAVSGLAASPFCEKRMWRPVVKGIPLRVCSVCSGVGTGRSVAVRRALILAPLPTRYRLASGEKELRLSLVASETNVDWYVDGVYQGCRGGERSFRRGEHTVEAVCGGRTESLSLTIEE